MVDLFDRLYTNIVDKNRFLARIKFYSFLRFIIRLIVNVGVPIYYLISKNSALAKLPINTKSDHRLIVSLTTFPKRINRIWIVIESLLRQVYKPDMIILWLSKSQFESIDKLPKRLVNLQKRGLFIRFCEDDLKSHKKYYYTLKDNPEDFLITVDDDIIYPTTMLGHLVNLNKKYPTSICCHRAWRIKYENDKILPYLTWDEIKGFEGPNYNIFLTSGGGTLFPPHSLHNEVLNEEVFKNYCFYADDVWLNVTARLNFTTIVKSDYYSCLLPVWNYQDKNLSSTNLELGENDKQLNFVRNYYINKLGIDAFNNK